MQVIVISGMEAIDELTGLGSFDKGAQTPMCSDRAIKDLDVLGWDYR